MIRYFSGFRTATKEAKDQGIFMIAASELACHIEIFDKDDYNTTDLTMVAKAQKES